MGLGTEAVTGGAGEFGVLGHALLTKGTVGQGESESLETRIAEHKLLLPEDHKSYTDAYFLRTNQILKGEGLNPFVRASLFIRKGPGTVHGIEEALAIIDKYSPLIKNGGRVLALNEGDTYDSGEPLMIIEGRVQDIIELETMLLGVITAETTRFNDAVAHVSLDEVTSRTREIKELIGDRPLVYGGARHWKYNEDAAIAAAAFEGGVTDASTDVGAVPFGKKGVGTIPHALEVIFAAKYGMDRAVREATLAFDRHIDKTVPRIALVDFNNSEVDDSVKTAMAMNGRLSAVRLDTCGENVGQLATPNLGLLPDKFIEKILPQHAKYWVGNGVTVTGALAVRNALDLAGFREVGLVLSSGFGKREKVEAFVAAEKILGKKLFTGLLVGGLYEPCRMATMDLVAVADDINDLDANLVSKVGRGYRANSRLQVVMGS